VRLETLWGDAHEIMIFYQNLILGLSACAFPLATALLTAD